MGEKTNGVMALHQQHFTHRHVKVIRLGTDLSLHAVSHSFTQTVGATCIYSSPIQPSRRVHPDVGEKLRDYVAEM